MKRTLLFAVAFAFSFALHAQTTQDKTADLEQRLDKLTDTLTQTQQQLQDSLLEIQRLRAELNALKAANGPALTPAPTVEPKPAPTNAELEGIHEQLDVLTAEVKQHEQTKVETASKYPLRITGLLLFNAYSNAGVVDNSDLPSLALARFPNGSHGSTNATLRQTILGVEAHGPIIGGAQTSASLNIDFFGGSVSNSSGYATSAGYVRLRTADLSLDWTNTTLSAGYTEPLITPLSPTSLATVAHPALSGSGNLWAWVPQVSIDHRVHFGDTHAIGLEGGLLIPFASNYANNQLNSPVSASRRPGLEGRVSYRADGSHSASPNSLVVGVSGYAARQVYSGGFHITSWAVTGDYSLPLTHHFQLSGEAYRGNAIGGLGGGGYNDALIGTNYDTAAAIVRPVETAGGWTQLKTRFSSRFEANIMYGIDDSFKRNDYDIVLPAGTTSATYVGRNQSFTGNLIFRPRSNIILSPEYRHLETWYYTGKPNVASIFTLSAGYQF